MTFFYLLLTVELNLSFTAVRVQIFHSLNSSTSKMYYDTATSKRTCKYNLLATAQIWINL